MADGNRRYKSDKKLYKVSFKLSEEDKRLLEEGAKKAGMNSVNTCAIWCVAVEMWTHLLRQTEGILSDR